MKTICIAILALLLGTAWLMSIMLLKAFRLLLRITGYLYVKLKRLYDCEYEGR